MNNNKTLVDFLKLDSLKISGYTFGLDTIIAKNLMPKYGETYIFSESSFDKPASTIERFFMSSEDTINNFFGTSKLERTILGFSATEELSDEERKNIINGMSNIKDRISKANEKELNDVSEVLTNIAERDCHELFYSSMVNVYHSIMKDNDGFSEAVNFLVTRVRPVLVTNKNSMSLNEINFIVGKDFLDTLFKFPKRVMIKINQNKDLTTSDVDDIKKLFIDADKKRNELHKRIFSYGEKYLKKDYLDVFIDIMSREYILGESMLHLHPVKNGTTLIFEIGFIDIPSDSSGEFSRDYGEGDGIPKSEEDFYFNHTKSLAERAYRALERAREEDKERRKFGRDYIEVKYKSKVKDGRSEAQDIRILNKIERRFNEYIAFNGDYALETMHGHHIFQKLIEIDVTKIRGKERYPEVKIQEIKDYIVSLLPKPK